MCKKNKTNNDCNDISYIVDYTKITLCPVSNYDSYCCICGNCEYCPYYKINNGGDCDGCGANYKHKHNPKARFDC